MGVITEWVRYGKAEEWKGYIARPDKTGGPIPAVLVLQEIWGVDEHIQDVTRRFAQAGYVALAPDLFSENGERPEELTDRRLSLAKQFMDVAPRSALADPAEREKALAHFPEADREGIVKTLGTLFGGLNTARHIEFLQASAEYLRNDNPHSRGCGVASVGFCMGGALSAQLACRDPELKSAVIFYGRAPEADLLEGIRCPVLGLYGEQDEHITGGVPAFADNMKAKGKAFDSVIYPGAGHAFFNDSRGSYQVEAARDAFLRTLQLFRETLA